MKRKKMQAVQAPRKTNLDAIKEYVAEHGAFEFINIDWLDAVAGAYSIDLNIGEKGTYPENDPDGDEYWQILTGAIRDHLDSFDNFKDLFDDVIRGGAGLNKEIWLFAEIFGYLSQEDRDFLFGDISSTVSGLYDRLHNSNA